MCRDDLSGNCKWWSTADIIKQLQQAQAQDVIKMTESSVTKHLLDGHFFSIWPQSWLRNWPRNNVVHARNAQLVTPTSREKVYSWLKMVWVNSSRASREEGNKSIDGTHRLCEMELSWEDLYHMETLPKKLFSRILVKSGKGKSSWTVGFKQRKTRRNWCGLLAICFAAAAEEGSFYFV